MKLHKRREPDESDATGRMGLETIQGGAVHIGRSKALLPLHQVRRFGSIGNGYASPLFVCSCTPANEIPRRLYRVLLGFSIAR